MNTPRHLNERPAFAAAPVQILATNPERQPSASLMAPVAPNASLVKLNASYWRKC